MKVLTINEEFLLPRSLSPSSPLLSLSLCYLVDHSGDGGSEPHSDGGGRPRSPQEVLVLRMAILPA